MAIDPEKVEQQLAAMVEGLKPFTEGADHNNVLARLQTQVVPAFVRWVTAERNQGTDENGRLNAFVCFVSSQMASLIAECLGDADFGEPHFEIANRMLQGIGEEVGSIMTGERNMNAFFVAEEQAH